MRRDLLIFALRVLKDECIGHWNCIGCPFDDDDSCRFANKNPAEWNVPDNSDEYVEPIDI